MFSFLIQTSSQRDDDRQQEIQHFNLTRLGNWGFTFFHSILSFSPLLLNRLWYGYPQLNDFRSSRSKSKREKEKMGISCKAMQCDRASMLFPPWLLSLSLTFSLRKSMKKRRQKKSDYFTLTFFPYIITFTRRTWLVKKI